MTHDPGLAERIRGRRAVRDGPEPGLDNDGHWNEAGNRMVAEVPAPRVAAILERRGR